MCSINQGCQIKEKRNNNELCLCEEEKVKEKEEDDEQGGRIFWNKEKGWRRQEGMDDLAAGAWPLRWSFYLFRGNKRLLSLFFFLYAKTNMEETIGHIIEHCIQERIVRIQSILTSHPQTRRQSDNNENSSSRKRKRAPSEKECDTTTMNSSPLTLQQQQPLDVLQALTVEEACYLLEYSCRRKFLAPDRCHWFALIRC